MNTTAGCTISTALIEAAKRLHSTGDAPHLEAQILLSHAMSKPRAWLLAHGRETLDADCAKHFDHLLEERLCGLPIAYLIGSREFWSRNFHVAPAVLIPRPETEHLIEAALEIFGDDGAHRIADLGTGSGIIAITLGLERPCSHILATDISADALAIAQGNAQRLGASNVEFRHTDWLSGFGNESFDLIISNPPYIAEDDRHLHEGDVRFEPRHALVAEENGLCALRTIIMQARQHLRVGGWLMLEHGYDQAAAITNLLREYGYCAIESRADFAGHMRLTMGRQDS
ncbi:MAG: peptide chain release factor N(5)-glutamine methyltransferase [Chromatiales bacterium]|nr:peptide chain release factor N(5)-glutamine methyltransferase [Chromatiales bacterium]